MIILDTNILSELMRPQPAAEVQNWLTQAADDVLVTTAITVSEIEYGLSRLPAGKRNNELIARFAALTGAVVDFAVLPFDDAAARRAGQLRGHRESKGLSAQSADMMIAGIAAINSARIATRNIKDFSETGVDLINPWSRIN
ncbi:MAG: type II toxin-antitoxin system VapC family toxin [Pseudomonadota bacterium]